MTAELESPPEDYARSILQGELEVTASHIMHLFSLLPREKPPRASEPSVGSSFTVGCYMQGGVGGLRHHTMQYPATARLLCTFVQKQAPEHYFTTISLFENVKTPMHRDGRNGYPYNAVWAISTFKGGQIWVQDCGGSVARLVGDSSFHGNLHELSDTSPLVFNARERYRWRG